MAKKLFLWIYTFQAILRPFYLFNFFFKISKFFVLLLQIFEIFELNKFLKAECPRVLFL
jgi:hypothetical protein